jgi:hypothetical protein
MKLHPLVQEFLNTISSYNKKMYCTRNNCGIASSDLLRWLEKEKKIGTAEIVKTGYIKDDKKFGGWIEVDVIDYSKDSFTKKELDDMMSSGYDTRKESERKRYVKDNNLENELKYIPHSWVEYRGNILDPSGFMPDGTGQFDNLILNKDSMDKRYKIFKNNEIVESYLFEGTYASYKLSKESAQNLSDWIRDSEIIEPVPIEELHVTTTYSEADIEIEPSDKPIILKKEDFDIAVFGRALVLTVKSDELQNIHKSAIEAGADYKYESYKPHISLSYNSEANDNLLPLLMVPDFDITLSHEEVEKLKESFEMESEYKFWGWIKPNGSLLLPTSKMRNNENEIFNHVTLLYGSIGDSYNDAYDIGMIRFLIDNKNILQFELPITCSESTIVKGYRNIENYLIANEEKIRKIFGSSNVYIKNFEYGLNIKKDNPPFGKNWYTKYEGNSLQELLNRIREYNLNLKLKEDIPANSTANIPVVPMPMTFKMFRRKKITEK